MEIINIKTTDQVMGGHKIRRSNLELYRIIVMLLIVTHHYVVNSGLMNIMSEDPASFQSLYLYLIGMWGKTGINCFVLITGYFMCRSNITLRKFLKLFLEIMFYNVVIWAIFVATGYESFSIKMMLKDVLPITSIHNGFTSCFLVFYLFIPFLNILVGNLDKKKHQYLLALCLFTYTFLAMIPKIHVVFNYVTWFSVLYLISSYIRLYGLFPSVKNIKWGIITLVSVVMAMVSTIGFIFLHLKYGIKLVPYRLVSDSNAIFAVIVSVCSFMYFKDLPIKQSKLINTISASTFGVLCIHANSDTMRQWLWKDVVDCVGQYSSEQLVLLSFVSIFCIFFSCIIIDYIRIHTLEKWTFVFVDKQLAKFSKKMIKITLCRII